MLDLIEAKIDSVLLSYIGSAARGEEVLLGDKELETDELFEKALLKFFLSPFAATKDSYAFSHHDNTKFNEVRSYALAIMKEEGDFCENAMKISQHLYLAGNHPNIKPGEFFVCRLNGLTYEETGVTALGLFKSETKDYFLTYEPNVGSGLSAKLELGAKLNALDKGALILLKNNGDEPIVLLMNKTSIDVNYWSHNFLGVQPLDDSSRRTDSILKSCISFAKSKTSSQVSKTEIIELNNYVSTYFEEKSNFDSKEFFSGLPDHDSAKLLEEHLKKKSLTTGVDLQERFTIDRNAAKKASKRLNRTIKLDTDIELKISNSTDDEQSRIEKGYDSEKKMHYYKIYFNEELG